MKIKIIGAAVVMAVTAVSAARAAEKNMDFDGRGPAVSLAAAFEPSRAQLPEAPAPAVRAGKTAGKVTIAVAVHEGEGFRKDDLVCDRGDRGAAVKDCRRQEDGRRLNADEIRSLRLEHYFQPRGLSFRALLGESELGLKDRYCHNPVKECDAWKTVGKKECVEWSDPTPSGYRKCLAMDWVYYDECAHYSTYCDD